MLLKRQRPGGSVSFAPVESTSREDDARIARWLQPGEILLDVDARTREQVVHAASASIGRSIAATSERVFDALWRREQAGSTALGRGFAIPHARIPGIARPMTAFLRTATPIDFDAADGLAVAHFLVIVVPADGDHDQHLRLLAMVARLFSDRRFARNIGRAKSEDVARNAFIAGIERVLEP